MNHVFHWRWLETPVATIEATFQDFTERPDIAILLINQHVCCLPCLNFNIPFLLDAIIDCWEDSPLDRQIQPGFPCPIGNTIERSSIRWNYSTLSLSHVTDTRAFLTRRPFERLDSETRAEAFWRLNNDRVMLSMQTFLNIITTFYRFSEPSNALRVHCPEH